MKASATKSRTGIPGFDEISDGGLPRGLATVVSGGPGSGKTIFATQSLVCGAASEGEPSVFVCFEETPTRLRANAERLGWDLDAAGVHFLDAQVDSGVIQAGGFDLLGLLASAQAMVDDVGARRIVFDGIDVLLDLLDDPQDRRRELFRLREWLEARELTTVITAKTEHATGELRYGYGFLEYLCESVVELTQRTMGNTAVRMLRIPKQRGSAHASYECPFAIGSEGIRVADLGVGQLAHPVSEERVMTGVEQLDAMLDGGYYRGSGVIISGSPGTAKTTLAGAFADAACDRGERTLLVSFDEAADQILRNLESVGIHLRPWVDEGLLRIYSTRSRPHNPHDHLLEIRERWTQLDASCLVVDPISALTGSGSEIAEEMALHLVDLAKRDGLTVVTTALTPERSLNVEATPIGLSTAADTWIHLSYVAQSGERNRALTIVKSRGMSHSNQVRELVLHDEGIDLAEVYASGGEVLMGTLRWEKEQTERAAEQTRQHQRERRIREAETRLIRARSELEALQKELAVEEEEVAHLRQQAERERERWKDTRDTIRELRRGHDGDD